MVYVIANNQNSAPVESPKAEPNQIKVEKWLEGLKLLQPNSFATCIFCKRLLMVEKVAEHVDSKHQVVYNCDKCGKPCSTQTALTNHKKSHDARSHECEVCLKRFRSPYSLKHHMKRHGEEREWVCQICAASYKYKCDLVTHARKHSNSGEYECNLCDKKFSHHALLNAHFKNAHATNLQCETCKEIFPNYYYLQKHSIAHKTPLRHFCPICKKEFKVKHLASKHFKAVHGNKDRLVCDVCGKTCSCNTSLRDHKLIHSGVKPFECHVCAKKFNTKNRLRLHVLVHTGLKPHSCKTCEKKFTQRSTLVIHMRSHTGERPYTCDLCDKAFVSRTVLNNHKRNHE